MRVSSKARCVTDSVVLHICVKKTKKKKNACDCRPASLSRPHQTTRNRAISELLLGFEENFVDCLLLSSLYSFILAKNFFRYLNSVSCSHLIIAAWLDCEQTIITRPKLTFLSFFLLSHHRRTRKKKWQKMNRTQEMNLTIPLPSPIDR